LPREGTLNPCFRLFSHFFPSSQPPLYTSYITIFSYIFDFAFSVSVAQVTNSKRKKKEKEKRKKGKKAALGIFTE